MEHALKWSPFGAAVAIALVLDSQPAMTESQARILLGTAFPNYEIALAQLATELHAAGDLEPAIDVDRRLLALRPNDERLLAETHHNLTWGLVERAKRLMQCGDEPTARALAREAFELDTKVPDQLCEQATELLQAGRATAAIPKYRVALLMTPARAHIHMQLALALAAEDRMDEALQHARRAQQAIPQDETLIRLVRQIETQSRR
jgi:tetratricopeptide (TPR) repeat protein